MELTTIYLQSASVLVETIFDIDESGRQASVIEIVRRAHKLGINPGGQVLVREVELIPDEYKNRLITDDALLLKLGSRGRSIMQYQ